MVCITSILTGEKREVPGSINADEASASNTSSNSDQVSVCEAPDYNHQDGVPYKLCIAYFEPDKTRARYNNKNGVCEISRTWPKEPC